MCLCHIASHQEMFWSISLCVFTILQVIIIITNTFLTIVFIITIIISNDVVEIHINIAFF